MLCDPYSPSRFSRDEVLGLTWAYVTEVLFCERDDDRNPKLPKDPEKKPTRDEQMREFYWRRGYAPHQIEEKLKRKPETTRGRRK